MRAIVVFESHWGNTAAVARAIAEGIGPDALAVPTGEATPDVLAAADLVVAGAPVMAFGLPRDGMIANAAKDPKAPRPADVSQPSLRTWLEHLPDGHAAAAAFETKLRWFPGGATGTIDGHLRKAGYRPITRGEKFFVQGAYGPLLEGELERARAWGSTLRATVAG